MRGDGVGVGDVGAVPGGAWSSGHSAGGDDGRGAGREHGSAMYSVDAGSMSVTRRSNRAGTGSASVTVHGSSLGLVAFTALGRVGQTGCEGTEWESETSVRCLRGSGFSGTRTLLGSVAILLSSVSDVTSFDLAGLLTLAGRNGAFRVYNLNPRGSEIVSVLGSSFAPSSTLAARVGFTVCERTAWTSSTLVMCKSPAGTGILLRVSLTLGEVPGSLTRAAAFESVVLSSVMPSNSLQRESVVIYGKGFLANEACQRATAGLTTCESVLWISDSALTCKRASGHMATHPIFVSLTNALNAITAAVSYDSNRLASLTPSNSASSGSVSVTVSGVNFGVLKWSLHVQSGISRCESSVWSSDTSVTSKVSSGRHASRRFTVTVGVIPGTLSEAHSIDFGSISATAKPNNPAAESASMTVQGSGLAQKYTQQVRMGQTTCEQTNWASDTAVRCTMTRSRHASDRIVITTQAQGLGTLSNAASYDLSIGRLRMIRNTRTQTQKTILKYVQYLGPGTYTIRGRVGHTGCEGTEWESETSVRCLVGHGARGTRRVVMTAGEQGGSMTRGYSVDGGA